MSDELTLRIRPNPVPEKAGGEAAELPLSFQGRGWGRGAR